MYHLPVFATAFRIFFLGCAVHATAAIALWLLKLRGIDVLPTNAAPVFWHTYEMVFGFSRAAIFGFLFTAGQHWSGKFLLGGRSTMVLFLLWSVGRLAFFLPPVLAPVAFAADIAASLFALWQLRHLLAAQQKHNHPVVYLFVIYLLAQIGAVLAIYVPPISEHFMHAVRLGLIVVVFFVAIIAGRVLPFFASVVVQGAKPRILPPMEKAIWPSTLAALLSFALLPVHPLSEKLAAFVFAAVAILHGVRWYFWRPVATLKIPILAILYVGYFWLALGFLLLALSFMGWLTASPAWHVFGIGAAGIFIFGMMTRVALGHTGRPIKAAPVVSIAYLTLNLAMFVRVALPLAGITDRAYLIAAILWIVSFGLYLYEYLLILVQPRIDGRPG